MRIGIVGARGGSHIGSSLERAALVLGHEVALFDAGDAFRAPAPVRHFNWRLRHRPPRLTEFSNVVLDGVRRFGTDTLIATGLAPLRAETLEALRKEGVQCINYLTDDPWNPGFRANWLLHSVATYDRVFSPRRSNLADLRRLGCADVRYLPFGYDPELFHPGEPRGPAYDLVFAGGADPDRVPLVCALLAHGYQVGLFGGGWDREARVKRHAQGLVAPSQLKHIIAASKVALCIVRRANRDGHAMRTFELPAMRACILAEDTAEHRAILDDTVAYYTDEAGLLSALGALLADECERERLAVAAHARIMSGHHTYADRLEVLLDPGPPAALAPSG